MDKSADLRSEDWGFEFPFGRSLSRHKTKQMLNSMKFLQIFLVESPIVTSWEYSMVWKAKNVYYFFTDEFPNVENHHNLIKKLTRFV